MKREKIQNTRSIKAGFCAVSSEKLTFQFLQSNGQQLVPLKMPSCLSHGQHLKGRIQYYTGYVLEWAGLGDRTKELKKGVRTGWNPKVWPGGVMEVQNLSLLLCSQVG